MAIGTLPLSGIGGCGGRGGGCRWLHAADVAGVVDFHAAPREEDEVHVWDGHVLRVVEDLEGGAVGAGAGDHVAGGVDDGALAAQPPGAIERVATGATHGGEPVDGEAGLGDGEDLAVGGRGLDDQLHVVAGDLSEDLTVSEVDDVLEHGGCLRPAGVRKAVVAPGPEFSRHSDLAQEQRADGDEGRENERGYPGDGAAGGLRLKDETREPAESGDFLDEEVVVGVVALEFEDGLAHAAVLRGELGDLRAGDVLNYPIAGGLADKREGAAIERGVEPLVAAGVAGEAEDAVIGKRGRGAEVRGVETPERVGDGGGRLGELTDRLRGIREKTRGGAIGAIPARVVHA